MRIKKFIALTFISLFISVYSQTYLAFELNEINVPDNAKIEQRSLILQGAGLHSFFFSDYYVAALYLENKINSRTEALQLNGCKRMLFHIVQAELEQEKFQAALLDGISANNTEDEVKKNQKIIKQFIDLFDTDFVKGDIVMVDYIPMKGTQVSIRGRKKGIIPEEHFYPMVLKVWMGGHPPTQQLQKALLGFK